MGLAKIDTLLDDRRSVPLPTVLGARPEEPQKPQRVCDDAYVAMRSMIHLGEDLVEQFTERDKFLSEPEESRDAAIIVFGQPTNRAARRARYFARRRTKLLGA